MSKDEIINEKLDEERMLDTVEDLLQDPFHYFSKTLHKDTIQIYALSISVLRDLYQKEKRKNNQLFEEYNKRVGTIIKYEQGIKSFIDDTNITDIEPWSEYKIKGQALFDLQKLLEE